MLLPKRKVNYKRMHERLMEYEKKLKEEQKKSFKELILELSEEDYYICDNENAIVVVRNPDTNSNKLYLMIHYRYADGKLVEVNRWEQATHYFGSSNSKKVLKDYNLFMVQGGCGIGVNDGRSCGSIYNYQTGEFVVEKGEFNVIGTTNWVSGTSYSLPNVNYLEKYSCFLAYFMLKTKYEEGDIISYTNPVTREEMHFDFNRWSGLYFALLNTDGTIRGNQLFYGRDFSRIEFPIDLNEYGSLAHFKEVKLQELEEQKKAKKEAYYNRLANEGKEFISPYQDEEVVKVLKYRVN